MIIGKGLLAKAFNEYESDEEIVIFASGVSNSLETSKVAFERERHLLKHTNETYPDKMLVYFSTCSIYDKAVAYRPYVAHKLAMEGLVRAACHRFLIIRLPNVVGAGGNEHTVLNYLVNSIKQEAEINLWQNATRNILDVEDVFCIVKSILTKPMRNKILNIANSNDFLVSEIVKQIEFFFGKAAVLRIENKGEPVHIDIMDLKEDIFAVLSPEKQSIEYIPMLLNKYFI